MKTVYLDTETRGLVAGVDELVAVGFAVDDRPVRVLVHDQDRELVQRVLDTDAVFVGHNLNFDLHFLEANGYDVFSSRARVPTARKLAVAVRNLAGTIGTRKP